MPQRAQQDVSPPPPTVDRPFWAAVLLAFAVPTLALVAAAGEARRVENLTTSPFGWNRLIVIHSFSSLILAWCVARSISRSWPSLIGRRGTILWVVVGCLAAAMAVVTGPVVEAIVDTVEAGYVTRLIVRILWCVVLQLPWCLWGLTRLAAQQPPRAPLFATRSLLSLGLVTAIGVPVAFLSVFLKDQTLQVRDEWQQRQFREAQRRVQRLCDVGSTLNLGERSVTTGTYRRTVPIEPRRARDDLAQAVRFTAQRIEQLQASALTDAGRRELADCYRSLSQDDQAEQTLAPIGERDPGAALTLAEIQLAQKRPQTGQRWAQRALQLAQSATPADDRQRTALEAIQLRAYDMLALWAGERADFATAESYLLEALRRFPAQAVQVHDRLGRHYEFTGDLTLARQHQQQAAQLDPERFPPPESLLRKMLSAGSPVGLARPKSSRYQ